MYSRLCKPLLSNSFFIFGARGTGKSSLLKKLLAPSPDVAWLDLLDDKAARRFLLDPGLLETEMAHGLEKGSWIVIDEVQKVPGLLDYAHRLIEGRGLRFALTGSSARKLKRAQANLLAGRAFMNHLHPLTFVELGGDFSIQDVLRWGTLPKCVQLPTDLEKQEFLTAYASTYLKEEIKEEQLIRRVEPFMRFLEVAAQCNGQILNQAKIARDAGTDPNTVERYYEILEDTLIGFRLQPFHRSVRKRQSKRSKFYFFDLGVTRALENTLSVELLPQTYAYGRAFEHFFVLECARLNDYRRTRFRFSYLMTKDDLEIDLIVERPGEKPVLIEIKSGTDVDEVELRRLERIKGDLDPCEFWVVLQADKPRQGPFYEILPWRMALARLFELS